MEAKLLKVDYHQAVPEGGANTWLACDIMNGFFATLRVF